MEKIIGWFAGLDFWGLWFPGMVFVLFQVLLVILVSGGQAIPVFEGFGWLLPFSVISFIAGCLMQSISLALPSKLHRFWFSENALSDSGDIFSDPLEVEYHAKIKEQLLPNVNDDKTVLNHYEASLFKAHPAAYSRTLDLLSSASMERQLAIAYSFAAFETCLLFAEPRIMSDICSAFSFSMTVSQGARLSLGALVVVLLALACLSFLRSRWLYRYRVRFLFRSVASSVDEMEKCLFRDRC